MGKVIDKPSSSRIARIGIDRRTQEHDLHIGPEKLFPMPAEGVQQIAVGHHRLPRFGSILECHGLELDARSEDLLTRRVHQLPVLSPPGHVAGTSSS
jgi:hypothetical protein